MDCFLVYFDPFVFCSLIDYFFPLPGLFLYVGSYITIIPAIVSTDAILSIALYTILAILHRVLHRHFGSNHVLLVLCASVPLGFQFFFSTFNRSFAFLSQRKNKVSLIPNRHHTLKRKRARRHKNTNKMQRLKKRRCPKLTRKYDVARPNMALSSSSKKEKFTNYSFFCFTVFVSEYSKHPNKSTMVVAITKKNGFNSSHY